MNSRNPRSTWLEGDPKESSKDQGLIVEFVDGTNISLHCTIPGLVLGEVDPEFNRLKLNVKARDNPHFSID